MKQIALISALLLLSPSLFAQWTTTGSNIYYSTGNVGINNSSPAAKLDIKASQSGATFRVLGTNLDVDFHLGHDGGSYGYFWRYKGTNSGNLNGLELWSQNTTSSDLMVYEVHQDGNVYFKQNIGMGTSSIGSHRLAVEGSIGAREVIVEASGWSDFVFHKNYELPSLLQVENYINQHGHLPNVPSEAEVMEQGINLGEMDATLLQKIEELTLYTIEQQKEIELLKQQLETLQNSQN